MRSKRFSKLTVSAAALSGFLLAGGASESLYAQQSAQAETDSAVVAIPKRASQTPAAPSSPKSAASSVIAPAPNTPVPVQQPRARAPQQPRPPRAATPAPFAQRAPRQVITVVHRLSGWKLLTLLSKERAPGIVAIDELPPPAEMHTNVVAGYVSEDGRTVVACLPQAEVEAQAADYMPRGFFQDGTRSGFESSELYVVRGDGQQFKANFVGLDGSTGLSFLEVAEPLLPHAPVVYTPTLVEGQRIKLYAPAPTAPVAAPPAQAPAAPRPGSANATPVPVGDTGVVYSQLGAAVGYLGRIRHAPSGKVVQATVRASTLSPTWAGSIAFDDSGILAGIVTQGAAGGETQLIPAEAVRSAAARVLARRASVPRPWLGARGDAVAQTPLERFVSSGWSQEQAFKLQYQRQGVLLTSVAPGTPAARAGLRPGDVVSRISERDVFGIEDFSFFLREAGGGSTLNFTVLRAEEQSPLQMRVTLSGAPNPARATQEAEALAAESKARLTLNYMLAEETSARVAATDARTRLESAKVAEEDARRAGDARLLDDTRKRLAAVSEQHRLAEARLSEVLKRVGEAMGPVKQAQNRVAEAQRARAGLISRLPLIEGLDAIAISRKIAERFQAQSGLLVLSVRPDSQAEAVGLKVGDVIETLNGSLISGSGKLLELNWQGGSLLNLGVVRDGQRLTFKLPSRDDLK